MYIYMIIYADARVSRPLLQVSRPLLQVSFGVYNSFLTTGFSVCDRHFVTPTYRSLLVFLALFCRSPLMYIALFILWGGYD